MSQGRQLRVKDVMTAEVHTIDGLATAADAMALMDKYAVSSLARCSTRASSDWGSEAVRAAGRNCLSKAGSRAYCLPQAKTSRLRSTATPFSRTACSMASEERGSRPL